MLGCSGEFFTRVSGRDDRYQAARCDRTDAAHALVLLRPRCGGDQRNGDSATMLVLEYDASAARTIRHKVARQGAACQLVPPFETQSLRASVIARR